MKKLVSLVLALAMLMSCASAWAAPVIINHLDPNFVDVYIDTTEPIFTINGNGSDFDWQITRTENGVTTPATVTKSDPTPVAGSGSAAGSTVVAWDYWYNGDYTGNDGGLDHHLVVNGSDGSTQTINFFVNYFYNYEFDRVSMQSWLNPDEIYDGGGATVQIKSDWKDNTKVYSHNTVCSFGPHFRDISPEMTDKWYMFTPVDLSRDGKQVFEMVGGNVYVIGTVSITVNGDEVVVEYDYLPDVYAYDEFYTFFPDYDSVTTVNPEEIETSYAYGQKLSIANDLGGDTDVLLFTCNRATFKSNNESIVRFYENIPWRKALRESMLRHIGKVEVEK